MGDYKMRPLRRCERIGRRDNSPPKLGGVAAPLRKCREATEGGADGVVPKQNLATSGFGTTPPARPFFELDGLAGTPPNSGGEFKRSLANSFSTSSARVRFFSPPILPLNLAFL